MDFGQGEGGSQPYKGKSCLKFANLDVVCSINTKHASDRVTSIPSL